MAKFYGVREGRTPGVYNNWADCSAQVTGYSGADYKSFNNEDDARLFVYSISESVDEQPSIQPETIEEIKNNLLTILEGTKAQDKFEILKGVQDIAMLLCIKIEGLNDVVDFM